MINDKLKLNIMERRKSKKGDNILKMYIKKRMKQIIEKKDIKNVDEQQGSKLSKDTTILSKLSFSPLNVNIKNEENKEEKKKKVANDENDIKIFNKPPEIKRRKTMFNRPSSTFSGLLALKGQLTNISELIVQQEPDISELLCSCCCQMPNNYHVYIKELNGHLQYVYKLREFSGGCNRFFCPVNCREFTMKMKLLSDKKKKGDKDFENSLMTMQKNFKIPCLCLIRPEMVVNLTKEKTTIGRVEHNFSLFDPCFTVYNEHDEEVKYIEADCCQWGYIFRNFSFGKSEDCKFQIYNSKEKIKPIGYIMKKTESVYSLGDSYRIAFPANIPPEEKLLLTIVAVLIDYQYYEKNNEVIK